MSERKEEGYNYWYLSSIVQPYIDYQPNNGEGKFPAICYLQIRLVRVIHYILNNGIWKNGKIIAL